MQVDISEAKRRLQKLIKAVEDGHLVTICRQGVPVVDMIPSKKPAPKERKFGTLKGQIQIIDPD